MMAMEPHLGERAKAGKLITDGGGNNRCILGCQLQILHHLACHAGGCVNSNIKLELNCSGLTCDNATKV